MTKEYMDVKSSMQYLGIKSYQTFKKLVNNGLPMVEVNGFKRVKKESLDNWLIEHSTTQK
ncbi:MAG: hypothetical protein O7C60_03570 [Rickettsia endosymbiont of Ixodes persulcatus]|nr:hypothetical protein [Rickettsia endosymbiont of Ixodes persulcatus]